MSYCIGNIIYGQTASPKLTIALHEAFGDDFEEDDYVHPLYEGLNNYFFGVFIKRIYEVNDVDLRILPTKESLDKKVIDDYTTLVDSLPKSVRDVLDEPKLMIVWERS